MSQYLPNISEDQHVLTHEIAKQTYNKKLS
jgi:hypothetical protein